MGASFWRECEKTGLGEKKKKKLVGLVKKEIGGDGDFFGGSGTAIAYVFRTEPIVELEKLPVHGSLVGPTVESRSNWWRHKYIIYKILKFKIIIKIKIIIYILFKI